MGTKSSGSRQDCVRIGALWWSMTRRVHRAKEAEVMEALLIEDNESLAAQLVLQLQREGIHCLTATTIGMASLLLEKRDFGLILLDLMLPDGSGVTLLKRLRAQGIRIPVIVLTARAQNLDKIRALDYGADDYLTKPFWPEELLARIRAVTRRYEAGEGASSVYDFGSMRVDLAREDVEIDGVSARLTPTEWALLAFLVKRARQSIRRQWLIDAILPGEESGDDALHAQVSRLRKKLRSHAWRIRTVWGIGYKFDPGEETNA